MAEFWEVVQLGCCYFDARKTMASRERERGEMEMLTYYHVKCHAGEATS
jgi:hypothetical protein